MKQADYDRIILVKKWGHRLKSKASADQLRRICESKLDPKSPLVINLAGVKACSPGFADQCFGQLLIESNRQGTKILFSCVDEDIRENILTGIKAAIFRRNLLDNPS